MCRCTLLHVYVPPPHTEGMRFTSGRPAAPNHLATLHLAWGRARLGKTGSSSIYAEYREALPLLGKALQMLWAGEHPHSCT